MDYYKARSRALQDVAQMMEKNTPVKKIYFVIGINYGFSPKACDDMIKVVEDNISNG